jgi:hypothetical protein
MKCDSPIKKGGNTGAKKFYLIEKKTFLLTLEYGTGIPLKGKATEKAF